MNFFAALITFFIWTFALAEDQTPSLSVTWTTIAGVMISDGETNIGIDLTFTRPELKHWLFNSQLLPNEELLSKKVKEYSWKHIDALLVSHTHFDHAIDMAWFSAEFHAPLYGTASLHHLAQAYAKIKHKTIYLKDMFARKPIVVGQFKITPIVRTHTAILQWLDWHFLPGEVPSNTQLDFYDYRTGDTWCYLIEHPHGNIYVDQGGHPSAEILKTLPKIDMAVLGVANKISLEEWINGYAKKLHPKVIMPVHYDWFFLGWPNPAFTMPGMQLDEIETELSKLSIGFQKNTVNF